MANAGDKVTIYFLGGMGNVVRQEAKLVEHGRKPYAQYDAAPFVKYIPKGKRNVRGFVQTYKPYLLILAGWDTPEPASLFGAETVTETGCAVSRSRYLSCDPRWAGDFDARLAAHYPAGLPLVADYRTPQQ